jgi:predicted Zn-dependent protease with MMP-like domain
MDHETFDECVAAALEDLPRPFRDRLVNVEVEVMEEPTPELLQRVRVPAGHTLLGLYQGVPLTQRSITGFPPMYPDRITLFRGPLLRSCATPEALQAQIRHTVLHEIAHFFGISDERLHELGAY